MTAAIYAARAGLGVKIVESNICGGLVNYTHVVENLPSYKQIHGMELMEKVREHVDSLGVEVEEASILEDLRIDDPVKYVRTEEEEYEAQAIILATGREPIPLDVADNCEQVHYCSICDGPAYTDKKVLVVGGGNSGFDEALALLRMGAREILLVEKMSRFFAAQTAQDALRACKNVQMRLYTSVEKLIRGERLTGVMLKNEQTGSIETTDVDGIFVFMGQKPNTSMFKSVVALDEQEYIIADSNMHTNLPGVFAAGDVIKKKYRQITTAMADGTIAALEAERYICRK